MWGTADFFSQCVRFCSTKSIYKERIRLKRFCTVNLMFICKKSDMRTASFVSPRLFPHLFVVWETKFVLQMAISGVGFTRLQNRQPELVWETGPWPNCLHVVQLTEPVNQELKEDMIVLNRTNRKWAIASLHFRFHVVKGQASFIRVELNLKSAVPSGRGCTGTIVMLPAYICSIFCFWEVTACATLACLWFCTTAY